MELPQLPVFFRALTCGFKCAEAYMLQRLMQVVRELSGELSTICWVKKSVDVKKFSLGISWWNTLILKVAWRFFMWVLLITLLRSLKWNLEWSILKLQVSFEAAENISRKAAEAAAAEAAAMAAHSNLTGMAMTLVVCSTRDEMFAALIFVWRDHEILSKLRDHELDFLRQTPLAYGTEFVAHKERSYHRCFKIGSHLARMD